MPEFTFKKRKLIGKQMIMNKFSLMISTVEMEGKLFLLPGF